MTQKYEPFHTLHETHCGDCDKLLTAGPVRHEDRYFFQGVRCESCYNTFVLTLLEPEQWIAVNSVHIVPEPDLGSTDPFDIEHYEGN